MINTTETRDYANFSLNLFRIRESKGMTREELLEKIGLTDVRIIYAYEAGSKFPSFKRFIEIAKALEVSLDSMVA